MKKVILLCIATIASVICIACSPSGKIDGTWYSVVDTTMYNFSQGEITVSGITVGQYEDNGDSVVISLANDGKNLQLYITTMDEVEVLADVKEGEGIIYFCKGLENAQRIMKEEAERVFQEYIQENIYGMWKNWSSQHDAFDYIEITEDGYFLSYKGDAKGRQRWINLGIGYVENELGAVLTITEEDGSNEWQLPITLTEDTYENDSLWFGKVWMEKVK